MMPPESEAPNVKRTLAVIELGRAWIRICREYGLDKYRIKQIAESMIALEDWEKK